MKPVMVGRGAPTLEWDETCNGGEGVLLHWSGMKPVMVGRGCSYPGVG